MKPAPVAANTAAAEARAKAVAESAQVARRTTLVSLVNASPLENQATIIAMAA